MAPRSGRPPVVDNHPKRDEILKALMVANPNFRRVSEKFNVSQSALRSFRTRHVTKPVQAILETAAEVQAETPIVARDLLAKVSLLLDRGYRMLAAADAWLEDPNAPGRYNLNPRTHEVDVVYERQVGDRVVRSTEKLGKLLCDVEAGLGITVVKGETKTADPRKLLLEAVAALKPALELLGKVTGELRPDTQVNVAVVDPVALLRAATLAAEERRRMLS